MLSEFPGELQAMMMYVAHERCRDDCTVVIAATSIADALHGVHTQLHHSACTAACCPPARLSSQLLPLTTRAIQMEQAALLYQKDNEIKDLNLLAV